MSERTAELLQEVLALPAADRAEFTRRLWESERGDLPEYPEGPDEKEEHAELLRRLASLQDGTADPRPLDEAMDQMRQELMRRRDARAKPQP